MIQEYLLQELTEKDAIKGYKPKDVKKRMFSANNEQCWYVQFSAEGENEETAKQLSEIDEYVRGAFHVTVLENGCSAYFNKRLYPFINEFENKLRKLLYLTSAINHDDKSAGNIADLESKDFGTIFAMLFVDNDFMGKVKDDLKKRDLKHFSKTEVIAAIESINENTLWDTLLGKETVPTLRKSFINVREYRNDVMHSHHIIWEKYIKIQSLYKAINNELDEAIHDIEVVESKTPSKPAFNKTLEGALRVQEQLSALADAMRPISELYAENLALSETMEKMREISSVYNASANIQKTAEQFAQIAKTYQSSMAMLELQEQISSIAKNITVPKFEITPEILRLQNSLASFQIQDKESDKNKGKDDSGVNDNKDDNGGNK